MVWVTACDFGSSSDDVVTGDVVDVLTPDNGQDSVDEDVIQQLDIHPDLTFIDTTTLDIIDVQADDTVTNTNLDQCVTEYDCDACMICTELQGIKQCVATPEAGMKECYSNDDCTSGVCHPDRVGKLECGGYCAPTATYDIHEWGVNVVTPDGATVQAGPLKYYGAIAAKPVIYIYSDDEFTLDVAVTFNGGVSAETWPLIPNSANVVWEGVQVGTTACTTTPTPQPDMSGMAGIDSLEIYDLSEWVVEGANCLTYGDTISKLLFYAGTFNNYVPQVEPEALIDSVTKKVSFQVINTSAIPIGPVIVLYRNTESTCVNPGFCPVHTADIAFDVIDSVDADYAKTVLTDLITLHKDATEEDPNPSIDTMIPQGWVDIKAQLITSLGQAGLTSEEITVFMRAWNQTFFGLLSDDVSLGNPSYNNGAFLIYLWPEARTDQMVPMTLVPEPTTKVRAIVEYQQMPVGSMTPL